MNDGEEANMATAAEEGMLSTSEVARVLLAMPAGRLLPTGFVADLLGTSTKTVRDWQRRGVVRRDVLVKMGGEWVGNKLKFTPAQVLAFLDGCNGRVPAPPPEDDGKALHELLARRKPGRRPGGGRAST